MNNQTKSCETLVSLFSLLAAAAFCAFSTAGCVSGFTEKGSAGKQEEAQPGRCGTPCSLKFPRSKVIDLSWSSPDVDYYVENLKMLEQFAPVDGFVMRVWGKSRPVDGKMFRPGTGTSMGKIPWEYEDFREVIAKLKKNPSQKFTDNFFYTTVSPGDVDWFSDADWKSVVNNYELAARIAKETGMKGVLVDIEEYGRKFWDFRHYKGQHTLAETKKMARQRGQEWGRAVFQTFPEGKYFFLHFLDYARHNTSMVGPFLDGIFDVIPPQTIIFDGQEDPCYGACCANDYDRIYRQAFRTDPEYLSPENRAKHHAQVRFAPAFYLDAIFPSDPKFHYHQALKPEIDRGAVGFFRANLLNAMDRAEGYIWLYGEQSCWWPKSSHRKVKDTWEQRAPGATQAVELARNPDTFDVSRLGEKNLIENSRWWFWQREDDMPKGTPKPGSGRNENGIQQITGVTWGSYSQRFPVKPGEIYFFRAEFRMESEISGSGDGNLTVAFLDSKQKWMEKGVQNYPIAQLNSARAGEWVTGSMVVTVPADAAFISVQLSARDLRPQDSVSFRNAVFIPIFK